MGLKREAAGLPPFGYSLTHKRCGKRVVLVGARAIPTTIPCGHCKGEFPQQQFVDRKRYG